MPESPVSHSFETAIGRLETLVEHMEAEDMPLEQLLVNYEEGVSLVKICQDKLAEAEKKIELIQKKSSGEVELRAFDPATPSGASPISASGTSTRSTAAKEPKSSKDISLF